MTLLHAIARLCAVLVLVMTPAFVGGCDKHAEDKKAIQAVIDIHARANEGKDGNTIATILSDNTFQHYERVLRLALDGTKAEVAALQASDRLEVGRIRVRGKRSVLEKMTGKQYAVWATNQGWYSFGDGSAEGVEGIELTDFKFAPPDTAYARPRTGETEMGMVGLRMRRKEKKSPFKYTFIKQADGWKYDETSAYEHWSSELDEIAAANRMDTDGLIIELLTEETGKKVPRSIFEKPMR